MNIPCKDIYQMMIAEMRYSFGRDNGCAITFLMHCEDVLPELGDWAQKTAEQICEEVTSALLCPELNGGHKHRATIYNAERDSYRVVYISNYEYTNKKCMIYDFNELTVEPKIVFEDEAEWLKVIKYASQFVSKGFVPYNDTECKIFDWKSLNK